MAARKFWAVRYQPMTREGQPVEGSTDKYAPAGCLDAADPVCLPTDNVLAAERFPSEVAAQAYAEVAKEAMSELELRLPPPMVGIIISVVEVELPPGMEDEHDIPDVH